MQQSNKQKPMVLLSLLVLVMPLYGQKKRTSACEKLMKKLTFVLGFQAVPAFNNDLNNVVQSCNFEAVKKIVPEGICPLPTSYNLAAFQGGCDKHYDESYCESPEKFKNHVGFLTQCCLVKERLIGKEVIEGEEVSECPLVFLYSKLGCLWQNSSFTFE